MGGASTGAPINVFSGPSARDLSAYRWHAGKINTSGDIDYLDTNSAVNHSAGVIDNKPAAETGANVDLAMVGSRAKMYVDGNSPNIAIGDPLGSNSNYHGVKVSGDDAFYFIIALEASTADGDLIDVLVVGPSYISGSADD